MNTTEHVTQTIERFIRKIAQKYPASEEPTLLTDIHVRANQENGDLIAYDDDDVEITRCVVEDWIDNKNNAFYDDVITILRQELTQHKDIIENLSILKPYSIVLEDEDRENIAELYVIDDETIIIGGELMKELDKDLDDFFHKLFDDKE